LATPLCVVCVCVCVCVCVSLQDTALNSTVYQVHATDVNTVAAWRFVTYRLLVAYSVLRWHAVSGVERKWLYRSRCLRR